MTMFLFRKTTLILLWIFGIEVHVTQQKECTFATPKKPIGYFDRVFIGTTDAVPFSSKTTSDKLTCEDSCRIKDECLAISFSSNNHQCSFYNRTNFERNSASPMFEFSIWRFCNMSDGQQPSDGRCPGQWVTYKNTYISVNFFHELDERNFSSNCNDICLGNELCGFVRRNQSSCALIPKWPYENLNSYFSKKHDVDNWTCVDNFVEQITAPSEQSKPLDEKCTGHWTLLSRNRSLDRKNITGIFFQTQIYIKCLNECSQYANCRTALYNVTYSICVLPEISDIEIVLPENETRFIAFEWTCVKNDSHNPYMNEDEKRFDKLGMKCYQIVKNTNLFIKKDQCGRNSQSTSFVPCHQRALGLASMKWNIKESCLINQTYWGFPPKVVQVNISGFQWMNLTKIYTGLQQYWLAYSDGNNLRQVDFFKCRSFNVSKSLEKLNYNDIVSRDKWHAQRPLNKTNSYPETPNQIVVTTANLPQSTCKTIPACVDVLRNLQINYFHGKGDHSFFNDILFNFLIDQSGHIYEGRGWKKICDAVNPYNSVTFCIAHIGSFKTNLPSEKFFISLKKLIRYSVENKHVDKNYSLYLQEDLGSGKDNQNLKIVLKNWYRYRGFLPNDCTNYSLVIIGLNAVALLLLCFLLRFLYFIYYFAKFCKKCSILDSDDLSFRQIFPCDLDSEPEESTETRHQTYKNRYIIYQKSSFVSSDNQVRIFKLVKIWFINQFLETIISRFRQSNLNNYLSSFSGTKGRALIYEIELAKEDKLSNCENVILCVRDEKVFAMFKGLVQSRRCICCYFHMELLDFSTDLSEFLSS